jgi:hypothetical protein
MSFNQHQGIINKRRFATPQQEMAYHKNKFRRLPKAPPRPRDVRQNPRQGKWSVKIYDDDFIFYKEIRLKPGRSGDVDSIMEAVMSRMANSYGAVIFRWYLNGRISHVTEY